MNESEQDVARRRKVERLFGSMSMPFDLIAVVEALNGGSLNPYHNTQHLFTVAIRCAEAADFYHLDRQSRREIVLAALFHDFDHPLNTSDAENIERAIDGWRKVGAAYLIDVDNNEVERMIRATEFPHREAWDLMEEIIQDADLMQGIEPDREVFYAGLSAESGNSVDIESTRSFLRSQHVNTTWGRGIVEDFLAS
jgi:hypothetical protein